MRHCFWHLVHIFLIPFGDILYVLTQPLESKIVGGKPAKLGRFPSAVQFFNKGSLCAGTILNSWTVLTAAHCFDVNKIPADMVIQIGKGIAIK
jgi:secreted trypsin-like serine protease